MSKEKRYRCHGSVSGEDDRVTPFHMVGSSRPPQGASIIRWSGRPGLWSSLSFIRMRLLVLRCLVLSSVPLLAVAQQQRVEPTRTMEIVIAATTDVHGRLRGHDYYAGTADSSRGLARAATIVDSVRAANPGRVVLVDAGDFLQGNPLTFVAARIQTQMPHPVVAAMNAMRYDAAAIGNHEFNYGLAFLARARKEASFPFLSANARAPNGENPMTASRIVVRNGVRIGLVGATTPGASLWDRDSLRGRLTLIDIVGAVHKEVVSLRRRGADVVVAVLHSGLAERSRADSVRKSEPDDNVAARVAREVPGIDAVVFGHSHSELADSTIGSTLLIQPQHHAGSVAIATLTLAGAGARWRVSARRGRVVRTIGHAESPRVLTATQRQHDATVSYVNSSLGTTLVGWRADSSRVVDTPIVDFMLEVMRRRAGTDLASTPSFALNASLDSGTVSVAELATLYPYENTLRAVRVTGRQLRAYIEQSARYFRDATVAGVAPGSVDPSVPSYSFDIIAGADYTLDLMRPIGGRVTRLEVKGRPVTDTETFTLALSNYRQTGAGGFAMLRDAPVVYDRQEDIRQLMIDDVREARLLDPRKYATQNWRIEPAEAVGTAYRSMRGGRQPTAPSVAGSPLRRRLRLIAINDFHGALEPRRDSSGTSRGGAMALAAEIARARSECVEPGCVSLLLDGGDEFQGTAASNFAFGRPVVALFNQLGLSAGALGNHEFDWGQDTLRRRMQDARYPILGANVRNADGSDVTWIPDDTLLIAGGFRIGVIGVATVETARTTKTENVADLRFVEPARVVDERARALRARGADFVVVVAHAGAFCDRRETQSCEGEIVTLAQRVTERVDAFVSGHTHSAVASVVRGAAIVQARSRGSAIGVVDLSLEPGTAPSVELRDVLPDRVTTVDSAVARIVADATESLRDRMDHPIARIGERMAPGLNGTLGNLIADAQRAAGEGDVAIMNTGGVRAPLDTGTATFGALFEIHPFANSLVRLTVTGRELREYLERVVSRSPVRAHLSGASVRFDPSRSEGSRVVDVRLSDGRPVDDSKTYRLVMTDFLSTGGDGLNLAGAALRVEPLQIADLDALIDYLRAQPAPVRAPTDRRLIPVTP